MGLGRWLKLFDACCSASVLRVGALDTECVC